LELNVVERGKNIGETNNNIGYTKDNVIVPVCLLFHEMSDQSKPNYWSSRNSWMSWPFCWR